MSEVIDFQQALVRKHRASAEQPDYDPSIWVKFQCDAFDGDDPPELVGHTLEAAPFSGGITLITDAGSIDLDRQEAIRLARQILGWMDV